MHWRSGFGWIPPRWAALSSSASRGSRAGDPGAPAPRDSNPTQKCPEGMSLLGHPWSSHTDSPRRGPPYKSMPWALSSCCPCGSRLPDADSTLFATVPGRAPMSRGTVETRGLARASPACTMASGLLSCVQGARAWSPTNCRLSGHYPVPRRRLGLGSAFRLLPVPQDVEHHSIWVMTPLMVPTCSSQGAREAPLPFSQDQV